MKEEKSQKELFEFQEPKKPFSKLAAILPKPDFEGRVAITLTLEKIVFIFIGIVMLMVIVFALGVERGRSLRVPRQQTDSLQQKARQPVRVMASIPAAQASQSLQKSFFNMAPAVSGAGTASQRAASAKTKAATAPDLSKPYTIVAVTFSKIETAQATAAYLTKEGFTASVVYSDPYYKVCVGSYSDTYGTQVQRDLAKVKRIYKDAFVRLR